MGKIYRPLRHFEVKVMTCQKKKKKGFWWKTDSFPFAFYQEKKKTSWREAF